MGERNSGTNYLEQLLVSNRLISSVGGMAPDYIRALARLSPWREAVIDKWFGSKKVWKHAYFDAQAAASTSGVKVVALSKHPLAWSLSMLRRPYHLSNSGRARGEDGTSESWHQLMSRTWPTQQRERISPDTGFELWASKYKSYLDSPAVLVLRYEELLANPKQTFALLSQHLGLEEVSVAQLKLVDSSTKADSRSSEAIRKYYLQEQWRSKLPSDYAALLPESTITIAKRLGYEDL